MSKILLHIGGEKTGTKSSQAFLALNATCLLEQHRVLYPTHHDLMCSSAHFPVAACLIKRERCNFLDAGSIRTPEAVVAALSSEIARCEPDITILSAEHFSSRLDRSAIARLRELLRDYEVEIVCYARRQDELALSSYSTWVMCGARVPFSARRVSERKRYFNYCKMLDDWADAFGESAITGRWFDQVCSRGSVIDDFMNLLGVTNLSEVQPVPRMNVRIAAREARVLMHINRRLPTWYEARTNGAPQAYFEAQRLRAFLLHSLRKNATADGDMPLEALISPETRQEILARFRASNEQLFAKYIRDAEPPDLEELCVSTDVPSPGSKGRKDGSTTSLLSQAIVDATGEIFRLEAMLQGASAEPVPEIAAEPVPKIAAEPVPEIAPEPVPEIAPEPMPEIAAEPIPANGADHMPEIAARRRSRSLLQRGRRALTALPRALFTG